MNSYTVYLSYESQQDIKEIYNYIKDEFRNQTAAVKLKDEIKKNILYLEKMPLRNPIVNDKRLNDFGIRMLNVHNYTIFYRVLVDKDSVEIVRVLYSKRNWINIL